MRDTLEHNARTNALQGEHSSFKTDWRDEEQTEALLCASCGLISQEPKLKKRNICRNDCEANVHITCT